MPLTSKGVACFTRVSLSLLLSAGNNLNHSPFPLLARFVALGWLSSRARRRRRRRRRRLWARDERKSPDRYRRAFWLSSVEERGSRDTRAAGFLLLWANARRVQSTLPPRCGEELYFVYAVHSHRFSLRFAASERRRTCAETPPPRGYRWIASVLYPNSYETFYLFLRYTPYDVIFHMIFRRKRDGGKGCGRAT